MSRVSPHPTGLTEPMLIRLDVESKLSDQLKVRGAEGAPDGLCAPHPLQATLRGSGLAGRGQEGWRWLA